MIESPYVFQSGNNQLIGIHHHSNNSSLRVKKAVIVVVGGAQTRVGSHRQFVCLARALAKQGVDVFRFDHSGVGDSSGDDVNFEKVKFDIDAAVHFFKSKLPGGVELSLWGLCDAASAIALYVEEFGQNEINHLVLLNPWVYQPKTAAKTKLTSYYLLRFKQLSFWRKLLTGSVKFLDTIKDVNKHSQVARLNDETSCKSSFIDEMLSGISIFSNRIDIILSENDLVAKEFLLLSKTSKEWKHAIHRSNVTLHNVPHANHTFAKQRWKDKVIDITFKCL